MKRLAVTGLVLMIVAGAVNAAAQSAFTTATLGADPKKAAARAKAEQMRRAGKSVSPEMETLAASAANSWLGAQLGYKFGSDSDELANNLLVSAAAIYDLPLKEGRTFHLPVISNFAPLIANPVSDDAKDGSDDKLKALTLSATGVRAGLYPYREITSLTRDDFRLILHAEGSWKLNGFKQKDSEDVNYLNQLRLGIGFEMAVGTVTDSHKPLTLSVTPVRTLFDRKEYEKVFKEAKSSLSSLEVVAVLPLSARTGVLFEYVNGDAKAFRAGVIVAAEK